MNPRASKDLAYDGHVMRARLENYLWLRSTAGGGLTHESAARRLGVEPSAMEKQIALDAARRAAAVVRLQPKRQQGRPHAAAS